MARWTKEQQELIDIGRKEFKEEVVAIVNKMKKEKCKPSDLDSSGLVRLYTLIELLKEIEGVKE